MTMSERTVLCPDHLCKHNNGGGYNGICNHPVVTHPFYTGGVDCLLMNTCQFKETRDCGLVITGGARGYGKSSVAEAIKKIFEEEGNDCFEVDRGTGKGGSHSLRVLRKNEDGAVW